MRFERRFDTPLWCSVLVPIASLAAALVVSGAFLTALGVSPIDALSEMWLSAFGDEYGLSESLTKAIPLMISAVGLCVCYKMLVWNIGAQGQIMAGALAAVAAVRYLPLASSPLQLALMALAAALAGGLWASVAGFLRAKWNVNEIISTLMLNYIAVNLKDFLVYGQWRDPSSLGFPMTPAFPASAQLPLLGFGRAHSGLWLAVIVALVLWWLLTYSRWGYEIRVIGENPRAARFPGIDDNRMMVRSMFIAGALCGLAGMVHMAGLAHRLQGAFSADFGYTAIIVAWLANLNPLAALLVAFLMGGLLVGGESMQVTMNLPVAGTQVIQGLILFFVVAGEFFKNYRLVRFRR